jgi:hypothetical protein
MSRFCNYFAIFLIFSASLQGCGGGGSSTPPIDVSAGVYSSAANSANWSFTDNEIWTFLLPDDKTQSPTPNWFGIKFINTTSFELYNARVSGVGTNSGTGSPTGVNPKWTTKETLRTGSISLTTSQVNQLQSHLFFPSISGWADYTVDWKTDQLSSGLYQMALSTSNSYPSNVTGSWAGNWYFYPNEIAPARPSVSSISFTSGQVSDTSLNVLNCDLKSAQLTPIQGVNAYLVTITIPANSLCKLSNSNTTPPPPTDYYGLAFLVSNPSTTRSTLFLMATAQDNRTLFFRGDQ